MSRSMLSDDSPLLSDKVYAQLLALLASGELQAHARLPSEGEMARRFAVSRPVLRQALARLGAEDRIYSRKGSGHYVSESGPPTPAIVFGALSSIPDVQHFLEFRLTLESESAALAAALRDGEQLVRIRMQRRSVERALAASQSGIEEDFAFHTAIARASGNRFYALTMEALAEHTGFSIRLIRDLSTRSLAPRAADVLREHAAIESAIASGDATRARAAMVAHLRGGIARLFGR